MKRLGRANWIELTCCVLLVSSQVLAGGGEGSQGPRFLGAGLDDAAGAYIQEFSLSGGTFPPTGGKPTPITTSSHPSPVFDIDKLSCHPDGKSNVLAKCKAVVTTTLGLPPCKGPDKNGKVDLIAINAKWDITKAALDFSTSTSVVFACADMTPSSPDPQDRIGAFGKCVGKDFLRKTDTKEFLACVRAMRADYCGNGMSLTKPGTPLAIYDQHPVCRRQDCFEATWDEDGAVCVNHARYEQLVVLSTKGGIERVGSSRKIPIDGMTVCGEQWDPIASCLAKFTDFYFNDEFPMGPNLNPLSVVTSQFVCKAGGKRKFTGAVLTRTMVQMIDQNNNVKYLPCCDTLKDCH